MEKPKKLIHVSQIRRVIERHDADGRPVPVRVKYVAASNGDLIDGELCVCCGVDVQKHNHLMLFPDSGQKRRLKDVLILQVDDWKIVAG